MDVFSYDDFIIKFMQEDNPEAQCELERAFDILKKEENPCAPILGGLLERNVGYSDFLSNLEENFKRSAVGNQKHSNNWFNTFPEGVPSDTYPYFLGVCRGNTRFASVMSAAKKQCKRMAEKYDSMLREDEHKRAKTVVILTEKWDTQQFRKYAVEFINYAHQNNVLFILLLVTDFGVKRIPFLTWHRSLLLNRKGFKVTLNSKYNALKRLTLFDDCRYEAHGSTLTYYSNKPFIFRINFKTREYCLLNDFDSNNKKHGTIPTYVLHDFACSVIDLADLPDRIYYSEGYRNVFDAPSYEADIFGKHFEWKTVFLDNSIGNNIFINRLNKAFDKLFKSLGIKNF